MNKRFSETYLYIIVVKKLILLCFIITSIIHDHNIA